MKIRELNKTIDYVAGFGRDTENNLWFTQGNFIIQVDEKKMVASKLLQKKICRLFKIEKIEDILKKLSPNDFIVSQDKDRILRTSDLFESMVRNEDSMSTGIIKGISKSESELMILYNEKKDKYIFVNNDFINLNKKWDTILVNGMFNAIQVKNKEKTIAYILPIRLIESEQEKHFKRIGM